MKIFTSTVYCIPLCLNEKGLFNYAIKKYNCKKDVGLHAKKYVINELGHSREISCFSSTAHIDLLIHVVALLKMH